MLAPSPACWTQSWITYLGPVFTKRLDPFRGMARSASGQVSGGCGWSTGTAQETCATSTLAFWNGCFLPRGVRGIFFPTKQRFHGAPEPSKASEAQPIESASACLVWPFQNATETAPGFQGAFPQVQAMSNAPTSRNIAMNFPGSETHCKQQAPLRQCPVAHSLFQPVKRALLKKAEPPTGEAFYLKWASHQPGAHAFGPVCLVSAARSKRLAG